MFGSPGERQTTNVCLWADNAGFVMCVVEIEADDSAFESFNAYVTH
jgi:hypothetical protein